MRAAKAAKRDWRNSLREKLVWKVFGEINLLHAVGTAASVAVVEGEPFALVDEGADAVLGGES